MRKTSLFSKERLVYWPEEFSSVMNQLTGRDADGKPTGGPAIYQYNTGALALAASIGLLNKRKRDASGSRKKEISTETFASHELEGLIFLIPLLANPTSTTEIFRPENEEELIREFERYAAGGLEILRGEFDQLAGQSTDFIIQQLHARYSKPDDMIRIDGLPELF
ncbi:hypothetical protein KTE17_21975 [Burkholderia gladioli]|uniref:hypothetical protein n=1 Tax=Burkholderia gladioli TaxID=28095 RepID=UPI001C24F1A8|nr:hypothetical protein [Burkholderia gladioli]MBU9275733.1 hypothetical protein [Burkholderia gladioli]